MFPRTQTHATHHHTNDTPSSRYCDTDVLTNGEVIQRLRKVDYLHTLQQRLEEMQAKGLELDPPSDDEEWVAAGRSRRDDPKDQVGGWVVGRWVGGRVGVAGGGVGEPATAGSKGEAEEEDERLLLALHICHGNDACPEPGLCVRLTRPASPAHPRRPRHANCAPSRHCTPLHAHCTPPHATPRHLSSSLFPLPLVQR
jgi:hypothetical protein